MCLYIKYIHIYVFIYIIYINIYMYMCVYIYLILSPIPDTELLKSCHFLSLFIISSF